jgi:hypothetical protein
MFPTSLPTFDASIFGFSAGGAPLLNFGGGPLGFVGTSSGFPTVLPNMGFTGLPNMGFNPFLSTAPNPVQPTSTSMIYGYLFFRVQGVHANLLNFEGNFLAPKLFRETVSGLPGERRLATAMRCKAGS